MGSRRDSGGWRCHLGGDKSVGIPDSPSPAVAAALLPGIILVRYYAKTREYPRATKGAVTVMFVATVAFLAYLLKQRII